MPVLLERTRPTRHQLTAVYAYIRRKREKGKQALAESRAKEEEEKQRRREEEKKKETVDDVRKEIAALEAKLCKLKREKHELFLQFKKALNEDEMKKRRLNQAIVPDPRPSLSFHVPANGGFSPLPHNVQGSPAVMESVSDAGFMQSQAVHSQQIIQAAHGLYSSQTSKNQPSLQEQFATFQHGPGPASVITSCQDTQQTSQHLKQQQQQLVYPLVQQQQGFQQNVQHFQKKQPIQQQQQQQTITMQYTSQHIFPGEYSQDQSCIQSYPLHDSLLQVQTLQQHQQPYQLHSHPQGYQLQPSAPYHSYHSQQGGQYPGTPEHQLAPEQHYPQQQQQLIEIQSRQVHHEPGQQLAEIVPHQQHHKQDLRPGPTAGHSQNYMQEYQQHHQQGPTSVKRGSLKSSVSPFFGSKGHSSSAGKKYSGKYQAVQEGLPSSSGPSGTSPSSRKHYPCRGHKGGSGYNAAQQKGSRY